MKNNIKITNNFKPSTNIIYDIGNKSLIESFIPTETSLDLIEFMIEPVLFKNGSSYRAHLLTGAYGKGKSYTVLLVINLLQNLIDIKDKDKLISKIYKRRPLLAKKIEDLGIENKNKLLPVMIKGGFSSLALALSNALSESLQKAEIRGIVLNSNFTNAIDCINKWETNYKDAYNRFSKYLKNDGYTVKSLRVGLDNHDEKTISLFKKIYPLITNGIEFNVVSEFQVIDDYKTASKELKKYGYSGLFIVYDEFSKFLESKHNNMSEGDIKILQDIAEISNSSTLSTQIHLSLISHKIPTSYFSDSKLINEWEAISGRFDVKDIYGSNNQNYEIIESMLDLNFCYVEKINALEKKNSSYQYLKTQLTKKNIFEEKVFDRIFRNCYPLHPISLYILPRLSEIIAQNERTLFSFIVSSAPNSLASFILNNINGERLYLDYLYDYFEPIFRNAPQKSNLFKVFLMVNSVQNNSNLSELSKRIIKGIALLIILDDEKIPPTFDSILLSYSIGEFSRLEIERANEELRKFGVVRSSEGNNHYIPFAIDPLIQSQLNRNITIYKKNNSLQSQLVLQRFLIYFLPIRYNDKNSITRYFKAEIITDENSLEYIKNKYVSEKKRSNGIVFILLNQDKNKLNAIIQMTSEYKLCFCLVPKTAYDIKKLESTIFEYSVIKEKLLSKNNSIDRDVVLRFIMNDDYISIRNQLSIFINPNSFNLDCYLKGKKFNYTNQKDISALCSKLYEQYLPNPVLLNREDINLEKPSKITIKASNNIVDSLLKKNIKSFATERKTSQTYSIFNSLRYYSNIINLDENTLELSYDISKAKNNFEIPLKFIREKLIESSKKEIAMSEIISNLLDVEGGIGIKKGIIPFFLAIAFSEFDNRLVISKNNKEAIIKSTLFSSVVSNPSNYFVKLNDWGENEECYINELCSIYEIDNFSLNIYNQILTKMKNNYQLLPLQTRIMKGYFDENGEVKLYSKKIDKLFNVINKSIDSPYSCIMEKIPSKIDRNYTLGIDLAKEIEKCYLEVESNYKKSVSNIKIYILNKLNINNASNNWLINMHSWVDSLTDKELMNLSNSSINIINLISEINDETLLFNKLTYSLLGLRFSDWSQNSISLLDNSLDRINKEIDNSRKEISEVINNEIAIIHYTDKYGKTIEKKIGLSNKNSYSRMFSDELLSIIEETGDALTKEDINKILLDIIINN